ncbi:MAG: hypothetical protein ACKOQ4_01730 [Mycobacterium sp.]
MSCPDINAGAWYLKAVGEGSWEVCEPVTGEVRARVTATGDAAAAGAGAEAVGRFLLQLVAEPGERPGQ